MSTAYYVSASGSGTGHGTPAAPLNISAIPNLPVQAGDVVNLVNGSKPISSPLAFGPQYVNVTVTSYPSTQQVAMQTTTSSSTTPAVLITAHDFVLSGLNLTVSNQDGIKVDGVGNVSVRNCKVAVSAATAAIFNSHTNAANGIWFNNATKQQLHGSSAFGDTVIGFKHYDVLIQGSGELNYDPNKVPQNPAPVGFTDCEVVNTVCDGQLKLPSGETVFAGYDGIRVRTNGSPNGIPPRQSRPSNYNVIVKGCTCSHIPGVYGQAGGILLSEVAGGVSGTAHGLCYIDHCIAHDNTGNGGVGIWVYNSSDVYIQYCQSYNNSTTGALDGDGFDLDWGTTDSVMQYNYSHDNGGGGFCIFGPLGYPASQHDVIRYNITAHDAKQNAAANKLGGIMISGIADASSVSFCDIYNNTVYMSAPSAGGIIMLNSFDSNFDMSEYMGFYNNAVYSTGTGGALLGVFGQNPNHVVIANNDYYDTKPGDLVLAFSNSGYGVFASPAGSSWQGTAAQPGPGFFDKNASPLFAWQASASSPNLSGSSPPFQTQAASPLRGQAMTVGSLLSGMPLGTTDFYGVPLPGATVPRDIGASQALSG